MDRIKVKHVEAVAGGKSKSSAAWSVFHILIFLFGGPIGWILALASGGDDENKVVNQKVKVKMPQCVLCRGETKVEIVESDIQSNRFQFWVNPTFAERFQTLNMEDRQSFG